MFGPSEFSGKRVLITGGLGFIGSNLAIRLVELGAKVTLMDAMLPDHGANLFNIAPIRDRVTVTFSDVRDANIMRYLVKDQEYLFHLAGHVDHVTSLSDPYPDIDINVRGTATVMEACRQFNRNVRVIYTGTRGQYGEATSLPVDETAPTMPKALQEISNLTAEKITHMYHDVHQVRSVMLRLTNIYGERGQMRHSRYGVANWFVRQAIDGEEMKVFGTGEIKRDFLYVDDCIEAMLMSALSEDAYGEILNVATGEPLDFITFAKTLVEVAPSAGWSYAPFSPERAAQEPGDFYADIGKIKRVVGWQPRTLLREGLSKTVAYYRLNKEHYW
ncbi:NAD-dependent dehydratase [Mycobacterium asiaticum]|uniref:NAD-dependent epimerase/dehydratase family protein n=1 Tax=Mycobacterium asiaticum TaxID=1790 RepID=UPI0007EF9ED7|nr:NAD-dependent epimerase/dehydratase family protein [Mycobacterium asiaticum]OBK96477.1 NAD-dependent dehydratase [Mycobacterium asiaticum]